MTPKIVDKEAKRGGILDAALGVFARRGFSRAKMEDIANAAGIGKGTIYEYFSNKDELFFALYDRVRSDFHQTIYSRAERQASASAALRVFIDDTMKALNEWQDFGTVLLDFWAEHRRGGSMSRRFGDVYELSRTRVSGIVSRGIEQGEFRRVDPQVAAATIIAVLDGLLLQRIFTPGMLAGRTAPAKIADIVLGGLRR